MAGRSSAKASSAVSTPSCSPLDLTAMPGGENRASGGLPVNGRAGPDVRRPGAQLASKVHHEHQVLRLAVGVAGQQLVQHGAVRLRHDRMQERGRGDHQHPGTLSVLGRVEQQAEVAVRHPAGLQDLAVDVGAELIH
jgi:hypothetical protein